MTTLYLDIETLPTESNEEINHVVANIKAPGNYKKPESIEAFIKGARDETIAKTALDGLFGRVYMIGYAIDDGLTTVIHEATEKAVLTTFDTQLKKRGLRNEFGDTKVTIVGHNAKDFDVPFLSQRLMVNGFKPLFRHDNRYPSIHDTMKMFGCGRRGSYYKLEALMIAFGLPCSKSGMDGSQVAQYYRDGRHDEVMDYCGGDVEDVRALYKAMTGQKMASEVAA